MADSTGSQAAPVDPDTGTIPPDVTEPGTDPSANGNGRIKASGW